MYADTYSHALYSYHSNIPLVLVTPSYNGRGYVPPRHSAHPSRRRGSRDVVSGRTCGRVFVPLLTSWPLIVPVLSLTNWGFLSVVVHLRRGEREEGGRRGEGEGERGRRRGEGGRQGEGEYNQNCRQNLMLHNYMYMSNCSCVIFSKFCE